ncbi:helix-turn-helix domain-containing protein [Streptomyces sp. NPDC007148]|uniref:helix-turn-helix domain-containing protein n=1 Tax=Streptomyces sp. NPDC007148 TaxID=3364775 RepID=UPI0036B66613
MNDDLYRRLGAYIRNARQSRGIAQEDLARAVKLTRGSIANLEAGRQRIQVHTLITACRALGIDPADAISRALAGHEAPAPLPAEDQARLAPLLRQLASVRDGIDQLLKETL